MTATDVTARALDLEHNYLMQTYRRPPFVLAYGEGVQLYDTEGRAYLDFVAGIAVNALGYGDAELTRAVQQAAGQLIHVSNLYNTVPQAELAAALVEKSFADRVFFCNSGAEANEGAIKFARKLAYDAGRPDKTEIVCFTGAFHGRTIATVSLTPKEKYQKPFAPLLPGVVVAPFNDVEAAAGAITDRTAAVIVEPVQGEGGINAATPEFLRGLRALCDEHDVTLIFDEIQCGLGRTGTLWAHEAAGVHPDIMTLAKPLANGLPIGAILVTEKVAATVGYGEHGSTFAGGPLVTRAASVVFDRVARPEFLAAVAKNGAYLRQRLQALAGGHVLAVRGSGLLVGVDLDIPAAGVIAAARARGLLVINAGEITLRIAPPLIVTREHIDAAADILGDCLSV